MKNILDYIEKMKDMYEGPRITAQEPRTMAQGPLAEDLEPGALRDEMLKGFDPSQETHEEYLQRINLERPFNAAQGGRIGFSYAGVVKQGPQTGMHKYLDFYTKKQAKDLGRGKATAEWFKTKKAMNAALEKRKLETGRGLTDAELTKKHKKELTKRGYNTWGEAPVMVKRSISTQTTPSALAKKEELPRWKKEGLETKISEKTRKLLAEKKPINPRTGLPYTLKEFSALTSGQKEKLTNRMKGKVKTRPWAKRQGWYPEKQANKLMTYLKHAAKKQENLPLKERNFINVWEGEKFVGVKDKRKNTLWTHVDYDLTGKKGTVITKHPGHKNIQFFLKQAEKFKYGKPDELLGSYFSKYKRVPTYSEIYTFFTVDPQSVGAKTGKAYKFNPLQQHHQELIAKEPAKSIQLTLQKQNTEASKVLNQFEKGKYSFAEADKKLKELGVRIRSSKGWMGPAKGEITAAKSIEAAKKETVQMFKTAVKNNPEIVDQMAKALKLDEKQKIKLNTRLNSGIPVDDIVKMIGSDFKIPIKTVGKVLGNVLKTAGVVAFPLNLIPYAQEVDRGMGIRSVDTGTARLVEDFVNMPKYVTQLAGMLLKKDWDLPYEAKFGRMYADWVAEGIPLEDRIKRIEELGVQTLNDESIEALSEFTEKKFGTSSVIEGEKGYLPERVEMLKEKATKPLLPKKEKTIDPFVSIFDPIPKMEFAGGGMAGIRRPSAIPPESGPQSQGLASLKKYGSYY